MQRMRNTCKTVQARVKNSNNNFKRFHATITLVKKTGFVNNLNAAKFNFSRLVTKQGEVFFFFFQNSFFLTFQWYIKIWVFTYAPNLKFKIATSSASERQTSRLALKSQPTVKSVFQKSCTTTQELDVHYLKLQQGSDPFLIKLLIYGRIHHPKPSLANV